jgi:hypothetical protein
MEVHHHTHPAHGKKSWREYFWEFFMLFLAVFCGFLAEIQVEHYVDHQRERKFMESIKEELQIDTANFNNSKHKILIMRPLLDSMYQNVKNPAAYGNSLNPKWNVPINETSVTNLPVMSTILQIKNSGNLRLIKSQAVLKALIQYETIVNIRFAEIKATVRDAQEIVYECEDRFCDYADFNSSLNKNIVEMRSKLGNNNSPYRMQLVVKDQVSMNYFANAIVNYKGRLWGYLDCQMDVQKKAEELLLAIEQEYPKH